MLLKLAHLTHNSNDLDHDTEMYIDVGFAIVATYLDIRNPHIKERFLSHFTDKHTLQILKKRDCIDVEIVQQNSVTQSKSFIKDIINVENRVEISIRTPEIKHSHLFWESLGFHQSVSSDLLAFSSVLQRFPIYVHLCYEPSFSTRNALDSCGIYSIAFLTHNAEQERKRLLQHGIAITEIETITVGENRLRVFFAIGQHNELVEIYDIET